MWPDDIAAPRAAPARVNEWGEYRSPNVCFTWNGSGGWNRLYSWVADKAASINITASRMDAEFNDYCNNGFGNTLTRDGQGAATANLPMNNFRHTGAGNGVAASDYATMGQLQAASANWAVASGTSDALAATYSPVVTALVDGMVCAVRASAANTTTAPTFAPNVLTAHTITRQGGQALSPGDIQSGQELILRYNLASTRWELTNFAAVWSTGDTKITLKLAADPGWIIPNDGTIGSASSGASTRANADCQALFTLLWTNVNNAYCPVSGGRGASAAADWAANKTIALPLTMGRALAVYGNGAGLTAFNLGQSYGENTHVLTSAEMPVHNHVVNISDPGHTHTASVSDPGHAHWIGTYIGITTGASGSYSAVQSGTSASSVNPCGIGVTNVANTTGITASSNNAGSGGAHNTMQPTSFFNVMIKL